MSPALRFSVILFALLCSALPARAAPAAALERGAAIIDPLALRELDRGPNCWPRPHSAASVHPEQSANIPLHQRASCLRCRRWLRSGRRSTVSSIDTLPSTRRACRTKPSASASRFDFQLFDRGQLYFPQHAFRAGGHRQPDGPRLCAPETCGEIRLIYRLTRMDAALIGENAVSPRLPMTLNVVLKAKGESRPSTRRRHAITCSRDRAPLARRRRIGR